MQRLTKSYLIYFQAVCRVTLDKFFVLEMQLL